MVRRARGPVWLAPALALALGGCELWQTPTDDDGSPAPVDGCACADTGFFPDAPFVLDAPGVDASPTNPNFTIPTATTRANERMNGTWVDVGDADWSCLGQPRNEPVPAMPFTVRGTVRDFQSGDPVGGASIVLTAGASVIGTGMTSTVPATRGQFTLTTNSGLMPGQRVTFDVQAAAQRPTQSVDRYLGSSTSVTFDPTSMSQSTSQALPAFVGASATPGTVLVFGSIRDCRGRRVSNTAVTVSQLASVPAHVPGTETFYFSAGSTSLPVRHSQSPDTNRDGQFMMINVEPHGTGFVQVWGFRSPAELSSGVMTLLGRTTLALQPDLVGSVDVEPLRP